MAITTAQLTDALEKSGLLTADRIKDCCETAAIPMETTSSEAVAKQLVRSGHLTRFQAQLALSGKASSLVIGSYVVLEKIGQGGMGQVYKARHKTMKREVALKVISPAVVKDETSRRRFQREVEAAAQLNHPNIVTAHDAGEFKGTHYLVMEYIKGTDLSLLVKAEGPISLESAVGYILQVARGLSFAHSQGIVHRDIKPANLLLDESGLVKILDMGLARFDDSNNAMNTDAALTGTGMLMGTIDYMSPEQAMDSKNADARSDIYSLGCTLYFLTTGRAMFETDTIVKRLMAHQSAIIPRISHADLGLQQILEKMTAKQPEQRYASCEQLIAELQVWINNNTVAGAPQRSAVSQGSGSRMSTPDLRTVSDNVASDSSDATMDTFVFAARNLTAAETTPSLSTSAETLLPVPDSPQRPPSTHTLPAVAASTAAPAKKLVMPETVALESAPSIIVDTQTALSSRGRSRVRLQNRNPQAAGGKGGRRSWKIYGGLAGGAALVLLAVLIFRLKTPTGTIIIEADQPDIAGAVISVDEKQTITLEIGNGQEPIEIRADEKEHTLKVTKGGFESFTQKFRVKAGATQTITVRLEPTDLERTAKPDVMAPGKKTAGSGWHGWPADAPPPAIAPFNAEQAKQHQKAWAKYLKIDVEYTNSIGMKFRLIPPGEFTMGSTPEEIEAALQGVGEDKYWPVLIKSEAPQHKVILTQPIYLGVNEVTQAEYEKVMGVNPSYFSPMGEGKDVVAGMDTASHPVDTVSWNHAAEFCTKLSEQEKLTPLYFRTGEFYFRGSDKSTTLEVPGYRLPTEAEWEYACRAGTTTRYWIGDKYEDLARAGWFVMNSGDRTHAASELTANPFGLCDIHGNVLEWVEDWWEPTYYGKFQEIPAINPSGPASASPHRVLRGGCYGALASVDRTTSRNSHDPADPAAWRTIGFRVSLPVNARRQPAGPTKNDVMAPAKTSAGLGMEPSSASTPPAPAAGPIDFAAERKAAEWVLSVGGSVQTIDEAGVIAFVGPGGKLPDGQWQLNTVWLTDCKDIKSADLDKLASCRSLITLNARVTNMGDADCQAIGRITNLESLDLTGSSQITNTGIKNLAPLRKLRTLGLTFLPISDEAMDVIAGMTELRSLDFGESGVGDEGLAKLKTLDKLEQFSLAPNITDRGLVHLTDFPNLAFVGVKAHQVTDVGVANLRKLPKLDSLLVVSATDADLERLKTLAHLKNLTLIYSQFSASSVENLQAFPQLEILNLNGSANIDDSHLVALSKLKKLRQLFVDGTSVTPEGIAKFCELRPDVELRAGGKVYPVVAGPIDYEAERKAAEWAIGRKVDFKISTAEGDLQPTDLAQLPNGPFHVIGLNLAAQPNLAKSDVEMIGQLRKLKVLNLGHTEVDDSSLPGISQLTELEYLDLMGIRVTDAGLAALVGLRNLQALILTFTAVGDDGMEAVAKLTNLRRLDLGETHVGNEGLAKLKSLQQIEHICLSDPAITDQGLAHLSGLPCLTSIIMKFPVVTDVGVANLRKLPKLDTLRVVAATDAELNRLKSLTNLKSLHFDLNQFTVSGLEPLHAFPKLEYLNFDNSVIVDDSYLVALSKLKKLRQLSTDATSVTPEGIAKFRELRPDVELRAGGKMYPAVAGPIDYEAERKAAEWVLSVGGSVKTIDEAGVIADVGPGGKLPDGQWQLNFVWLENCKNIISGDLEKLASCRSLKIVGARDHNIGDADCMAIGRMANLEVLDLLGCAQITNAGITNLGPLRKLRELGLTFIPISDDAMDVIAGMTELRTLGLGETQVTDVGFKKLAPLVLLEVLGPPPGATDQGLSILGNFPQLKLLGLKGHQITDILVAQLQKLPKLTTFSLVGGTDDNLLKIKGLTQLRELNLNLCQLTEQGFQTLLEFKWLQTVGIGGDPKFDDTRLMSLSEITDLKVVYFDRHCSVSPKGIENFQAARPDVRVRDGVQDYPATVPAKAEEK